MSPTRSVRVKALNPQKLRNIEKCDFEFKF